ncbi:MAG: radical SAM protein, partial [Spirochaetales bacterium]|nr:radical SAM protein [Spirochaetales bacterium]
MSVTTSVVKRLVGRKITRSLTGRLEDLRKLTALQNTPVNNPGLNAFLRGLSRDIEERSGMANLFLRVGSAMNPRAKRKLVENLIFNWGVQG